MIKQDIVHNVVERTGLPRTKAEAAVDTVFEGLKQALAAGERIELRGFGVFSVRARKTGIGRNPRTGTEVNIAPGKAVRFKPGKELHALAARRSQQLGSGRGLVGGPASGGVHPFRVRLASRGVGNRSVSRGAANSSW